MIKYKELEGYISDMFVELLGSQAEKFGFSAQSNERCLAERQNKAPLPDASTILYFRVDNYENWRSQRYGRGTIGYDKYGSEYIAELRTFKCIVTVMSKELGSAFDSSRFLIANLQNNRYNTYVNKRGRLLGIEQIYKMKNLSDLENGTWTERIQFEIQMNFREVIKVNDPTLFVRKPENIGDMGNSVSINTEVKK